MRDQPTRPAFVWLVVLVSVVYAGFFAFTAYEPARHHGVVKHTPANVFNVVLARSVECQMTSSS